MEAFADTIFAQLLSESDIISIHAPLNASTLGLIGRKELGQMKKEAVLLNLGRGAIVDEAALAEALEEGQIAGAGLDVLESAGAVLPIRCRCLWL